MSFIDTKINLLPIMKSSFLIAGTKSGSGKTLITLGIMAALLKRGLSVQPFKCGPDFIDPTLHKTITKNESYNLDLRMCGEDFCSKSYLNHSEDKDLSVIEGVMGLFDGGDASSASLAKVLGVPVILVIDVRSAAESISAILLGFETLDKDVTIAGVIFNFVGSDRHRQLIQQSVEKYCTTPILGFITRNTEFHVPERHLGLHLGDEVEELLDQSKLTDIIEQSLNIDQLIANTKRENKGNETIDNKAKHHHLSDKEKVRLGVAKDKAFCFYYRDNFTLFERNNIEIVPFSPMNDSNLPENLQGLYIGGGYPELFAKKLSQNISMRNQINELCQNNYPVIAECGGFMYLCKELIDIDGNSFPMTDIFPMTVIMRDKLVRLGYRQVKLLNDSILGLKNDTLYGHEFHYSDIVSEKNDVKQIFINDGSCNGYTKSNVFASYIHFHFSRTEPAIMKLYNSMLEKKK